MQRSSRKIKIKFEDEVINLIVKDNTINKATLTDYFPEGGKLIYKENDNEFILSTDRESIFLNPDISEYLYIRKNFSDHGSENRNELPVLNKARLTRFKEMLDKATKLKKTNNDETKDKITQRKVANKKQEEKVASQKTDILPSKLQYVRRVIHVGWLHKKSMEADFENMGPAIGRKKKVYLNGNIDYNFAQVKSILKEKYIDDENRYYFERSAVTLGTVHGDPIFEFKNKLDQKCGLWEYSKTLRNQAHKLNIVLLTIIINPDKSSSTGDVPVDSVMKELETKNFESGTSSASTSKIVQDTNDESFFNRSTILKRHKELTKPRSLENINSGAEKHSKLTIKGSEFNSKVGSVGTSSASAPKDLKDMDYDSLFKRSTLMKRLKQPTKLQFLENVSSDLDSSSDFSIPSPKYSKLTIKGSEYINKAVPVSNECSKNSEFSINQLSGNGDIFKKPIIAAQSKELKSSDVHNLRTDILVNYPSCSSLKNKTNKNFSKPSPVYSNDKENCDNESYHSGLFAEPYVVHNKFKSMNLSIPIVQEKEIKFLNLELGRGGQGVVMKGKFRYSDVAIKSMQVTSNDKYILREVKLLDKIRHPNIISIMAVCQTITQIHIVMEFFDSHSLYDILHVPNIKEKYWLNINNKNKIARQVCSAVAFLHLQVSPIVHRDIKPSNILVDLTFRTKVCDLGLGQCKSINESLQSTRQGIRGTYLFMAPEVLMQQKSASTSSDIWSIACTFTELYTEKKVWNIDPWKNVLMLLMQIFQNQKIPSLEGIPTHLQSVFQKCFNYEELERPGITDLLELYNDV